LARKKIYGLLAAIWTLFILIMCLISFNELPSVGVSSADKYVHATFHFVFTILWFLALDKSGYSRKILTRVFLGSVVLGIAIEIMQGLFTKTRQADIYDVFANIAGALMAVLLLYYSAHVVKTKAGN